MERLLVTTQCDFMQGKSQEWPLKKPSSKLHTCFKTHSSPKVPKTALGSLPKSCLPWNCFTRWGKKMCCRFSFSILSTLEKSVLTGSSTTVVWMATHIRRIPFIITPPPPDTKSLVSKQALMSIKPENEGFNFTCCCCSFLQNPAKMQ